MENTLKAMINKNKVIAYTGKFGTGKTMAIKTFLESEDNKGSYEPIIFNAWEFDYADNPKSVFINELLICIYKKLGVKEAAKKILFDALNLVKNLLTNATIDTMKKIGIDGSGKEDEFNSMIKGYQTERSKIKLLRKKIEELVSYSDKKIVIIIDDLDRSRPDFALEIFEIAKHIFAVDNISLILVYDSQTMNRVIENKYGNIGGEGYLNKYIDFECPHEPVKIKYNPYNENVFEFLVTSYSQDISIRTIEKFKSHYETNIPFIGRYHRVGDQTLYAFLMFVKMINPHLITFTHTKNEIFYVQKEGITKIFNDFRNRGVFDDAEWDAVIQFENSMYQSVETLNGTFKKVMSLKPKD